MLAVASSFLAQGSARLLPLQRNRRSFSRLPAPRTSKLLWCVLRIAAGRGALHEFLRVAPHGGACRSGALVAAFVGSRCVLISVLDVTLARTAFMRSLWLTRREHLDDQREAYGAAQRCEARARSSGAKSSLSSLERRP